MLTDEEYRDRLSREVALEKALQFITSADDLFTADETVGVAELFYDFIKGDAK